MKKIGWLWGVFLLLAGSQLAAYTPIAFTPPCDAPADSYVVENFDDFANPGGYFIIGTNFWSDTGDYKVHLGTTYPWGDDTFRWFNVNDPVFLSANPNLHGDSLLSYPGCADSNLAVLPFSASGEEWDTIKIHYEFTLPQDNLDRYGKLSFVWQRNRALNFRDVGNENVEDEVWVTVLTRPDTFSQWDTLVDTLLGRGPTLITTPDSCPNGWKLENIYVVPSDCCPLDSLVRIEFRGITGGNGADFWLDNVVFQELTWENEPTIELVKATVPFRAGNELCDPNHLWRDSLVFKIRDDDPHRPFKGDCEGCYLILRATGAEDTSGILETVDLDTVSVGPICPGDSAYVYFWWYTSKLHYQENYRFDVVLECPYCEGSEVITSVGTYVLEDPCVYFGDDFENVAYPAQDSIPLGWERIVVDNEHEYPTPEVLTVSAFETYYRDSFNYPPDCPDNRPFWRLGPFMACGSQNITPVDPPQGEYDPPYCDSIQSDLYFFEDAHCWSFDAGSQDDSLDISWSYVITFESVNCCNGPRYPVLEYLFWNDFAGSDTAEIRVYGISGNTLNLIASKEYVDDAVPDQCWIHDSLQLYECPETPQFDYDSVVVAFYSRSTNDHNNPSFDYIFLHEDTTRIDVSPVDFATGCKFWENANYFVKYDCNNDSIVYDPANEALYVTVQNLTPCQEAVDFDIVLFDSTETHGWQVAGIWNADDAIGPCGDELTYELNWQPSEPGCHWLKVATTDPRDCIVSNDTLNSIIIPVYVFHEEAQLAGLDGGFEDQDSVLTPYGEYFYNVNWGNESNYFISWFAPAYPGQIHWETRVHEDTVDLNYNPPNAFNCFHYARFRTHEVGQAGAWALQSYIIVDFSTEDTTLKGHINFKYWNPDGPDYLTVEWIECEPGENAPPSPEASGWHTVATLYNGGSWEPTDDCLKGWMDVDIFEEEWTGKRIWIQFVAHKDSIYQDPSNIAIDGVEAYLAPPGNRIYGNVAYCNYPDVMVPGVEMDLSGSGFGTTYTNDTGYYQFLNLLSGGDYTVTPSMTLSDEDVSIAVHAWDAALVLQNVVGSYDFGACESLAADVNCDSDIGALDAAYILNAVVGNYGPDSLCNGMWKFQPSAGYVTDLSGDTELNFETVVPGDVDLNYGETAVASSKLLRSSIAFGKARANEDGSMVLPIIVNDVNNLYAFECAVDYDASVLKLKEVKKGEAFGNWIIANNDNNGTVNIALASGNAFSGTGTIVELVFEPTGEKTGETTTLTVTKLGLNRDVAVTKGGFITTEIQTNGRAIPKTTFVLANRPNPFSTTTEIQYGLSKTDRVTLNIYDASGRLVKTLVNTVQQPGYYTVTWNGLDRLGRTLPQGVYYFYFKTSELTKVHRMLILR